VKKAEELQKQAIKKGRATLILYDEMILDCREEGDLMAQYEKMTFSREKLYEEIWSISTSGVSKKYNIPYSKLKKACIEANIPTPSNSYWTNISMGREVSKEPLPSSDMTEVIIQYGVKDKEVPPPAVNVTKIIEDAVDQSHDLQKIELKIQPQHTYVEGQRNIYDRNVLYNEVWNEPVTTVAKRYGVSDVAIHKICKSLSIPVPPRGYWAMKNASQPVKQIPLPEYDGPTQKTGSKSFDDSEEKSESDDVLSFLSEDERIRLTIAAQQITILDDKYKLHLKLNSHKAKIKAWRASHARDEFAPRNRDTYRRVPDGEPFLYNDISDSTFPRVYRILNTLFQYVEAQGGSVNDDLSLMIRNEKVYYSITEGQDQVPHVLTKDEQKQWDQYERDKKSRSWAYEPKFRKWDYIPNGKLRFSVKANSYFRDSETIGLELRLGEILIALFEQSENVRIEREKREEAQRKAEEEKRQREIEREYYNQEVEKVIALENEAKDYDLACKIRAYISAVESKGYNDETTLQWIEWAKAKADWYDPTVAASDPDFGKRNHTLDEEKKRPSKKSGYSFW
jgi:hypothetical protein